MIERTALTSRQKLGLVACGAVVLALHLAGLGAAPLLEPDEGRYLEIPREMLASGDWVTPRLDGVLYFEKPPLHYWLNALSLLALDRPEVAARIWNATFGLAGVLLTFLLGASLGGRRVGFLAAGFLGTAPYWVGLARLNSLDMSLSFFVTLTLVAFWHAHRGAPGWGTRLWWWGAFAAAAAAVLTKGLVGAVIPAAVASAYLVLTRQWSVLRRVPWFGGTLVFCLIAAPWHLLATSRNPDFAWFYFVHEHVLRYATPVADRQEPWWFFLAVVALGCVPWSGLVAPAAASLPWRGAWRRLPERPGAVFLWSWFGFVMAFFSASQSKLIPYVLPAVPALAVLVALAAEHAIERGSAATPWWRGGIAAGAGLAALLGVLLAWAGLGKVARLGLEGRVWPLLLASGAALLGGAVVMAWGALRDRTRLLLAAGGGVALVLCVTVLGLTPRLGAERGSKALAQALGPLLRDGDLVYSYRDFHEGLPVYLARTIGVVESQGELSFGISHLTDAERRERFPTVAELKGVWFSGRRVWLACNRNGPRKLAADGLEPFVVVWQDGNLVLVTNRPL